MEGVGSTPLQGRMQYRSGIKFDGKEIQAGRHEMNKISRDIFVFARDMYQMSAGGLILLHQ